MHHNSSNGFSPLLFLFITDLLSDNFIIPKDFRKSSIRKKLKKLVLKALTNGSKHDIMKVSKLSVVCFNTDMEAQP
jgi:hypothetical protein